MSRHRSAVIAGTVCLFLSLIQSAPVLATPLVGVTFGTSQQAVLYDVNQATGAATSPRAIGVGRVVGIAYDADGLLYGLTNSAAPTDPNSLVRINPTTGASQLIGSTQLTDIREGDLAFDPASGKLYGCYNVDSTSQRMQLFTIDLGTGEATLLAGSLSGDVSALAFTFGGSLYALDTAGGGSLLRLNKSTGALISSVPLSHTLGSTAGMAVDPDTGIFYVADAEGGQPNTLYTLNRVTGALTPVGPTGLSDGLAGLACPLPEPATLTLLSLGTLLLGKKRDHAKSL